MRQGFTLTETFTLHFRHNEAEVQKFSHWLTANRFYPLPNTYSGGPEDFSAQFQMNQKNEIISYFEKNQISSM